VKRSHQDREMYPFFYECLMLPLFSGRWVPRDVSFDLEPAKRHTSFYRTRPGSQQVLRYYDFWNLFNTAGGRWIHHVFPYYWRRMAAKLRDWNNSEDDSDNDSDYMSTFVPVDDTDDTWFDEWHRVMDRLEWFYRDISDCLDETEFWIRQGCPEADQLRAYLLRMRNGHACNPFAADWDDDSRRWSPWGIFARHGEFWRCPGEDCRMRQQLIQWAGRRHN
jgi:hypothetical protein